MGFFGQLKRGVGLALLKAGVAEETAGDERAFVPALFVLLLPSVIVGILVVLLAGAAGGPSVAKFTLAAPLLLVFGVLASFVVWFGILHMLARLFGGQARFLDYFQTLGLGSIVLWGAMVPFLNYVVLVWSVVIYVVITARVHKMSTGKAAAVVLIPYALLVLLAVALVSFGVMAGMMGGVPGMEGMDSGEGFHLAPPE